MTSKAAALLCLALALVAARPVRASAQRDPGPAGGSRERLTVAVAANMKPAFDEIVAAWRRAAPPVEVLATYGASVALHAQIVQGAPFDLFLSADAELPRRLADAGLTVGAPFIYARGALVLWVRPGSKLRIDERGLAALRDGSVRRVAIGNPRTAPYGKAAEEALRAAGVLDAVAAKLVMGQSVAQTAQFAMTGAADAALLPASLVRAPPLSKQGRWVAIPARLHAPVDQAAVVLASTARPDAARSFAEFLRGPDARRILESFGYAVPVR